MRRKLILLFSLLVSCVLLSGSKKIYADENGNELSDIFQLTLYADESLDGEQDELDLSGIKIDVYSSELAAYDEELLYRIGMILTRGFSWRILLLLSKI